MRLGVLAVAALAWLGGCAEDASPAREAPPIAVGVAVPGAAALWAGNPTGGAALLLEPVRRDGMDPRDVCFRIGFEGRASSRYCAVRDPDGGVVELKLGMGPSITVVAGHAGAAVRKLLLEVEGESHELPVSSDGAFLAAVPASYRGHVALVARNGDGTVATHSFAAIRRPGAVFDGEIGKPVIEDRREALLRRLGPPASRRGDCWVYSDVGRPELEWHLCFEDGRVARDWGDWGD